MHDHLERKIHQPGEHRCAGRGVLPTLDHGFQSLIDALNALRTTPTTSSCQGDGSQATFYELLARFDQGPDVLVRIDPHCAPAIDNRSVQASDANSVMQLLGQLLPPR